MFPLCISLLCGEGTNFPTKGLRSKPGAKLRYYGWGPGGGELVLPDQNGVTEVVPDGRTFQSLINISFPKIVGEWLKKIPFFTNFPIIYRSL